MMRDVSLALLALLVLDGPIAGATTCFEVAPKAGQIVNAPADPTARLTFMMPRRGDEIGKLTLWNGTARVAESVVWYTPGEPIEFGIEGDAGVFTGTEGEGRVDLTTPLPFTLHRRGKTNALVIPPLDPNVRVKASHYRLVRMHDDQCTRLYPDQGKVVFD